MVRRFERSVAMQDGEYSRLRSPDPFPLLLSESMGDRLSEDIERAIRSDIRQKKKEKQIREHFLTR